MLHAASETPLPLLLADASAGGGQTVVTSWGLDITAIPEPAGMVLVTAGLLFLLVGARTALKGRG